MYNNKQRAPDDWTPLFHILFLLVVHPNNLFFSITGRCHTSLKIVSRLFPNLEFCFWGYKKEKKYYEKGSSRRVPAIFQYNRTLSHNAQNRL